MYDYVQNMYTIQTKIRTIPTGQAVNPLPYQQLLARIMYIYTYKYVQITEISTLCIMVYVSCKYNTYIHVQHRISPDHYVLVCILYVYTYMTCTDTFIPEPNVFVCILYVYTYMTCTDTFIPEPNVRLRRREERRSSLSFSGGRTLSYFISNGAHILYV